MQANHRAGLTRSTSQTAFETVPPGSLPRGGDLAAEGRTAIEYGDDPAGTAPSAGRPPTLASVTALIESVPGFLFVKDMGTGGEFARKRPGRYVLVSHAGEALMGRSRGEILGKTDLDLFTAKQARTFRKSDWAALSATANAVVEQVSFVGEDGREQHLRFRKLPVAEANGLPRYVLGVSEDVTEHQRDLDALREQNRLFDAAIEGMSHGLCMVDADERMIVCNDLYLRMFGLDPAVIRPGVPFVDILRHSVNVGIATQTVEELLAVRRTVIAAGQSGTYHEELSNGRLIAISHRPMPLPQGPLPPHGHGGWVSIYEDVTEQRRADTALQEQNRRFDAALTYMGQGLCMYDARSRVTVYNQRFLEVFGLPPGAITTGQTYREVVETIGAFGLWAKDVGVDEIYTERMAQIEATASGAPPAPPLLRPLADGRVLAVLNRPMVGGGWVSTFEDVTERLRSEAQIAHMACHDGLTDLPNRASFQRRVEQVLSRERRGASGAVFYIDLDGFKAVNDSLGHLAGDLLLRAVAERLKECVRDSDTVARLGGDEFAILQVGKGKAADAATLADRLVKTMGEPFLLNGNPISLGMSIGIAVPSPDEVTKADKIMNSADLALYRAKAEGGHRYRFFEPLMEAQVQARRKLEADLMEAVKAEAFNLVYQPIVDLRSSAVAGFEALVRWDHPTRGRLPPCEFIPAAEETGLIVPMGEWILNRACADAAKWPKPLSVAVNVSAAQFRDPGLVSKVTAALHDNGLPASRLEIEITESVLLRHEDTTLAVLHKLRAMGIRIAMDDFGTGYSSLSYLRSFPFDKIKVDRSFIQELGTKPEAEAIVHAVSVLAASLGMEITAEGVETPLQLERLRKQGCMLVQGYLFSRPQPAGEIPAMMISGANACSIRAVA